MATTDFNLLCAFETHDVRAILDRGFDVRSTIEGQPVVNHLIEMCRLEASRCGDRLD